MPVVYSRKRLRALQSAVESTDEIDVSHTPSQPSKPPSPETPKCDPPLSRPPSKRRKRTFVQTYIDVGQRDLSARRCQECGMVYAPGARDDDAIHVRHHTSFLVQRNRRPSFSGWLGERVLGCVHSGKLVAVKACDVLPWRRHIYRIDAFVTEKLASLSAALSLHPSHSGWLAILFVVNRTVEAYALADLVSSARPASISNDGIATISTTAEHIRGTLCGIRKIWVADNWRRKGIATEIVDAARLNLLYGHIISRNHVAFTPTTPAGARFARTYGNVDSVGYLLIYTVPTVDDLHARNASTLPQFS